MLSTFGAFEAAKSGLSVSMQHLNVTEQNIANVNTEGYTRQRILTSAKEPASGSYLIAQLGKDNVGQGVETTGIQQIRSAYLDQQYRNMNTNYTDSSTRESALKYLSSLFNELNDDSSMTTAVTNFFSAVNTFASNPSLDSYRTNVQQQAESMTETFRNVYQEAKSLWQDQNDSINEISNTVNSLAQSISSLNDLIARSEQTVSTANDLVDERNLLLDKLSGYVNITYNNNPANGSMVDVSIGGQTLVSGKTVNKISVSSITDIASQIAKLNQDIAGAGGDAAVISAKQTAIGELVTTLKSFTSAAITTPANGTDPNQVDVQYNGISLVTGISAATADTVAGGDDAVWADLSRNNLTIAGGTKPLSIEKATVTGGQLYANMQMVSSRDINNPGIPYYLDQLNNLVRNIARNINNIHQTGYTYPSGATASKNDVIFFDAPLSGTTWTDGTNTYTGYDYSRLTAGTFKVSDAISQSIFNIAGSSSAINLSGASPDSGNNTIALKLSKDLDISGYKDTLTSVAAHLGITAKTTVSVTATKQSLLSSIDTQRKSTSAVSLDEETTNLIIYQQSYNAAARVITTLDDMLDRMINNMGIS